MCVCVWRRSQAGPFHPERWRRRRRWRLQSPLAVCVEDMGGGTRERKMVRSMEEEAATFPYRAIYKKGAKKERKPDADCSMLYFALLRRPFWRCFLPPSLKPPPKKLDIYIARLYIITKERKLQKKKEKSVIYVTSSPFFSIVVGRPLVRIWSEQALYFSLPYYNKTARPAYKLLLKMDILKATWQNHQYEYEFVRLRIPI